MTLDVENEKPLILYSPTFHNQAMLDDVMDALSELGYTDVDMKSFNLFKHRYTDNNLGIYLPVKYAQTLPPVMRTDACNNTYATIERVDNSKVIIEVETDGAPRTIHGDVRFESDRKGTISTPNGDIVFL